MSDVFDPKRLLQKKAASRCQFVKLLVSLIFLGAGMAMAETKQPTIIVEWDKVLGVSKSNASLQAVVTPLMARDSQKHDQVWGALKELNAKYVRYVPWLPYPKLAVAELEPPADGKTSWDFSLIDPFAEDFLSATEGQSPLINFSTIPEWMFKTTEPVTYPADPYKVTATYTQGTQLRDPSMKELGDYYARLVSWYTKGGFTDEFGKWYPSPHHYKFDYWEVLNEPDMEHSMTPEQYTARYDAIVSAIRGVNPKIKFVGMALALPTMHQDYFEYFLDSSHHKPGTPIDMISYHFYAAPAADQPPDTWQYSVFDQTLRFTRSVRYIESVRKRLAPSVGTAIDEIGIIAPNDDGQTDPGYVFKPLPAFYWNLSAAQYAYMYGELAQLGIDMVGASALMQLPGFFPSVSMMDWTTGKPNARYWGLKLIRNNFGPGDKVVDTKGTRTVYGRGFISDKGIKKLLLVNMRNHPAEVQIAGVDGAREEYVDQSTGHGPAQSKDLTGGTVHLDGFAVAVLTLR